MNSRIPLVLLCGGKSSRMGKPKHLFQINGLPIWRLLKLRLESVGFEVKISCNQSQIQDFPDCELIIDKYESIGPIGGITTALTELSTDYIAVLSCDTPLVNPNTLLSMVDMIHVNYVAVCAKRNDSKYPEPTVAIWNCKHLSKFKDAIFKSEYSLMNLLKSNQHLTVIMPTSELDNANTPEEWNVIKEKLENQVSKKEEN